MLALIHENTIISTVRPGGWFTLPEGSRCSPAEDGWTDGTYRLAAILPADPVPEGKQIVSTSLEMVEGQPQYVHVLEDVPPVDLAVLKISLKSQIDADAEAERLKYITPGAGQAMAYLQKAMEATAYLAATDPDPADYPLLAAEVGITGDTIADVAAVVDGQYQAWRLIGAAIEQARLGAKADVDAAETVEDAQAAYEAVVWPSV